MFSNNLAFYLKDLKLLVLALPLLKLVASSFKTINYLLRQNNLNYTLTNYTLALPNLNPQHHLFLFHQFCDTSSKWRTIFEC